MRAVILIAAYFFLTSAGLAQSAYKDSAQLDYRKIYSWCLDADVKPALDFLTSSDSRPLSAKDRQFKTAFENRFGFKNDQSDWPGNSDHALSELLNIYRTYWRVSLLDTSARLDSVLIKQLAALLEKKYGVIKDISVSSDELDIYLKKMIGTEGYFTTGFGKTGRLYDLLIWKKEQDTLYVFSVGDERTSAHVIFMDDFLTLGWEQYATLDRYYPGGWATDSALYCVKKAYDLTSEDFLISYLAHESRHFADYKLFLKLTPADLEYRAKLVELSLADSTLYSLIDFFIGNANAESDNSHSVADYYAIRDLSIILFHKEYEKNSDTWKKISRQMIHQAARQILDANTKALLALGPSAGNAIYIKRKGN